MDASRQLTGESPKKEPKRHHWVTEAFVSTPTKYCLNCGVAEESKSFFRADVKGMSYVYTDANGKRMESLIPLDECPTFIGDTNGALAEAKQRLRNVTRRVEDVDGKVESLDDRVARLERENASLKQEQQRLQAELDRKTVDVTALVRWLAEQVALYQSGRAAEGKFLLPEGLKTLLPTNVTRTLERVEDAEYVPISTRHTDDR